MCDPNRDRSTDGYKVTVLATACATVNPESERVALTYLEAVVGARIETS